jgi:hypothetical protein
MPACPELVEGLPSVLCLLSSFLWLLPAAFCPLSSVLFPLAAASCQLPACPELVEGLYSLCPMLLFVSPVLSLSKGSTSREFTLSLSKGQSRRLTQ